jgi:hypothetical protein
MEDVEPHAVIRVLQPVELPGYQCPGHSRTAGRSDVEGGDIKVSEDCPGRKNASKAMQVCSERCGESRWWPRASDLRWC